MINPDFLGYYPAMIQQINGVYRVTTRSPLADAIMFLLFPAGLFLLCMGIYDKSRTWVFVALGLVCIVAGVLMLTVFKFRKLVAEVSEKGIVERVSKVSKGLIRWDEIADIFLYEVAEPSRRNISQKGTLVGISLVDMDAHIKKLNIIQKGIIAIGLKMGYAPINIPGNLLGDDAEAFVELCKSLAKKAGAV